MQENTTITEQLEEIAEQICDNYCKYIEKYSDYEKLVEEKCEHCPLWRIVG